MCHGDDNDDGDYYYYYDHYEAGRTNNFGLDWIGLTIEVKL